MFTVYEKVIMPDEKRMEVTSAYVKVLSYLLEGTEKSEEAHVRLAALRNKTRTQKISPTCYASAKH
jgi:hypothetical protein